MSGRAQAAGPKTETECPSPGSPRSRGRGWAALAAFALILIANAAWPAPALAGHPGPAPDGEPVAASMSQALAEVGAWLLDLTGRRGGEAPPEAGGDDGIASAQAPMGPLIDPDGYTPRGPKPGGKPHDR